MTRAPRKSSLQQQIDENLKRVFEETLQQDVPDRFKDLLAQLRARESEPRTESAEISPETSDAGTGGGA